MVTHHPLAIAELEKEQIQVLWRDVTQQAHAVQPAESPRGMGYAGILTSDMFGLRSTLDNPTEDLLRQRREIIEKPTLATEDYENLKAIDSKIEPLGFTTAHWDNDYQEYLQLRKQVQGSTDLEENASPITIAKRRQKAKEIIERIIAKEKQEEDNASN